MAQSTRTPSTPPGSPRSTRRGKQTVRDVDLRPGWSARGGFLVRG